MVIRKCISLFCKSYKYIPFNTFVKSLTAVRGNFHQTVNYKGWVWQAKIKVCRQWHFCIMFVKYLKFIERIRNKHWYDLVSHNRGCLQTQQNYFSVSIFRSFEAEEALSVSNSLIWTAKANPDVIGLSDTSLHMPCTWCKTHP